MKGLLITLIHRLFNRLLKIDKTDNTVLQVKEQANKKISKVSKSLEKAGTLQNRIMEKTTTYYVGRAIGIIK